MHRATFVDSFLVSFTPAHDPDDEFMLVGRKTPSQAVEIVNAIQGPRARDLYESLIQPKKVTDNGKSL